MDEINRYASVRAIETPSTLDDQQWLTYWILYSLITLFELSCWQVLHWYVRTLILNGYEWMWVIINHYYYFFNKDYKFLQASILAIHEAPILYMVSVTYIQWSSLYLWEFREEVCESRRQCQRRLQWGTEKGSSHDDSRCPEISRAIHLKIWSRSFWKGRQSCKKLIIC